MPHTLTTCTFCGVGCGIYLESAGSRLTGAYPSMTHPTNQGRICVRGWHVNEVASAPDRLLTPLLRKHGTLQEATWEEALGYAADRLRWVQAQAGPNAVGFINSPRGSNEESYLLQKFARALIGTNNVDHGLGVYRNNSIDVLLAMLGIPASTNSVAELDTSDAIIVNGVDLGLQLPTIGGRVMRAKLKGRKLIVIDPRRHRLAEHADCFLQLRPGSDAALYGALAKVIVDRGLFDARFLKAHCRNVEAFLEAVHAYDVLWAADACGIPPELIEEAAVAYGRARAAAILFSTGVEASGAEAIQALVNLALLTGNIGKAGAGMFALTEHNNLQGVCDMGMLPNRLPGYVPVADDAGRRSFEVLWGAPLPIKPGQGAEQLLGRHGKGAVRALWLCRHDPVMAASADASAVLRQLDLVIVQHPFLTETAKYAHVVLPVAAFGEEQVAFTNTERRIQARRQGRGPAPRPRARLATDRPHGEQPGGRMGVRHRRRRHAGDRAGRPLLWGRDLRQSGPGLRPPVALRHGQTAGNPLPLRGGDRRAALRPGPHPAAQPASLRVRRLPLHAQFRPLPVLLASERAGAAQRTLKREYQILLLDYPEGFVDVNADDAKRLEIRDGAKVRLVGVTGVATTWARVTREVKSGMIFVPYFLREVRGQPLGDAAASSRGTRLPVCVRLERV